MTTSGPMAASKRHEWKRHHMPAIRRSSVCGARFSQPIYCRNCKRQECITQSLSRRRTIRPRMSLCWPLRATMIG